MKRRGFQPSRQCIQGQTCKVYGKVRNAGSGGLECGGNALAYCLNNPGDPNLTCHCPYRKNFADPRGVCEQGKTCYGCGKDPYDNYDDGECGNGHCLNSPDNPNKTCHCPYVPPPAIYLICRQGQQCEE